MIAAVIGHGPSPAGKGWGAQIDACERVVRMWDCQWQPPADYGTKFDVGVFTVWPKELEIFRKMRERVPGEWWAYDLRGLGRRGHVEKLEQPVRLMDPEPWVARARALGAWGKKFLELTRGCMAVVAALEWLRPERLHIVGFDDVSSGMMTSNHYNPVADSFFRSRGAWFLKRGATQARTTTHDFAGEGKLIRSAAAELGTEIRWTF